MLQKTFNDYQNLVTTESVKLTASLLDDIENGRRNPVLNGEIVTFREKEIAAYLMDSYASILQEYVLTDISDLDNNYKIIHNLMSRDMMKQLMLGVNKITGYGFNESEDFILDRELYSDPVHSKETFTSVVNQRLFKTSDYVRGYDLIFINSSFINNINNYYEKINSKRLIFNTPLYGSETVTIFHTINTKKTEFISKKNQSYFSLSFMLRNNSLVFRNDKLVHDGYQGIDSTSLVFSSPLGRGEKIAVITNEDITIEKFIGDGIKNNFGLSHVLSDKNLVFLNGELLTSGYHGLNTSTLSFDATPANGDDIAVILLGN